MKEFLLIQIKFWEAERDRLASMFDKALDKEGVKYAGSINARRFQIMMHLDILKIELIKSM